MKLDTSTRYDLNGSERRANKSSGLTCEECGHKSKTPGGKKIHIFRVHTARGRKIAKRAGLNFLKPSTRRRAIAARRGKAVSRRQVARPRAVTTMPLAEVHYCPRCGLNIHNISLAVAHGG